MAIRYHHFFVAALLFVSWIQLGSSLECYACSDLSAHSPSCEDPFDKSPVSSMKCAYPEVCGKQILKTELGGQVTRSCWDEKFCTTTSPVTEYCSICDKDFCNAGTILIAPFAVIVLCAVKNLLIYL